MVSDILTKKKRIVLNPALHKNSWVKCISLALLSGSPCNSLLLGQTAKNLILSFNMKKEKQNSE